jgi:hypothetical protein
MKAPAFRSKEIGLRASALLLVGWLCALAPGVAGAEPDLLDLREAVVVTSAELTKPESAAIDMLLDEVEKRSIIRWKVAHQWPADVTPVIAIGTAATAAEWAGTHSSTLGLTGETLPAEGYRVRVVTGGEAPAVLVAGNDSRGVLFGIGRLLQEMRMYREESRQVPGHVRLPADFEITTAPKYPLRGHQFGYRPKVNSYDGWTPDMWEQYIRDLAVFGTNAFEMIPPRSDDAADSPHFPLPQIEMMAVISEILDKYDLDVWIWYPALDDDYTDPATEEFALQEWEGVFEALPRIDAILVPGGDPGQTPPKVMFPFLEKQTAVLKRHHPEAEMWMSPQGFTIEFMEDFYELVRAEPEWLTGVAVGPLVRDPLPLLREKLPDRYPIRRYPDITHSLSCQYPVHEWDLAYAMTLSRETINPRPFAQTAIVRAYDETSVGFITYSEGVNDDVNKIIWSELGWNPEAVPYDTLRRFSRYFVGPDYADPFAQGLLALEQNWKGALLTNQGVETTLQQFQAMEKGASPQDLLNWRFQQGLYRAYYDAYTRRRLLYETGLEKEAMDALGSARPLGTLRALDRAEAVLDRAVTDRVATHLRQRVFELAEALYQSIRMQLDVERYRAISVRRGANLANIDVRLNDRLWLRERFAEIRAEDDEEARLAGIQAILDWTNPGPGGFYDDLGRITAQPHLVPGKSYEDDPQYFESPQVAFGGGTCPSGYRLSWCRLVDGAYGHEVKLHYPRLDPEGAYRVRIVYAGRLAAMAYEFADRTRQGTPVMVRLTGDDQEIHPMQPKPNPVQPVEFDVPTELTRDGELTLGCTAAVGGDSPRRGCQIAEVWLMKK